MYQLLIIVFLALMTQGQQVTLSCPDSWTLIGTTCYRLFSSDQNRIWESAEGVCLNQGSHLASIRDIYENNEIGRFANSRTVTEYWIGLLAEPAVIADNAHWSNGKNWSLLQGFWADEQPDTSSGKCVYVKKQSMDYTYDRVYAWNVGDCNVKRSFICQRMTSPTGSYNCANGGYVSPKLTCDGEGDCSDLSDEISCAIICQYNLKASFGIINSEGYPNNYTNARFCSWNIEGPLGSNIYLEFTSFQTEARSDIVKIFVGGRTESTSTEVASLSGTLNITKAKYLSPNNYMIIQFSTDSAFAKQGFSASYSSISDGESLVSEITVTDNAQSLQPFTYTVAGQKFYLGSRDYIWKLTALSPRAIITIKVITLDLKGSDVIYFYDGDSSSASMLAKLCETCDNPGIIFSTSDKLYIIMKSGMGLKGSGFNFTMIQGCNIYMTDSYGTFFSPGYGMVNYANGQTCTWTIQTTPEMPILVYFEDGAEIEDGVDILQVFTNATNELSGVAEHFPNQGFRTNDLQHRKFVSSNGKVLIKFITNPITNKKGFMAFYSQDCPDPQFSKSTSVTPVATNYPQGSTCRYKDEVDVTCSTGYRFYQESLLGQATVRLKCLYKGIFNLHQVPNCQPYYCGEPPVVKFGYILGTDGVTFRSKANYSCYPGYSFQNKSQITCQDGGWETAPICVAAKCTAQTLIIASGNGTLRQGDGTSVGTIIDYVCKAGYQIQGSSILLCGPNGNWSSTAPTCIKLNCPLPRVKNGNFTVTSFPQLGDVRTLQCSSGYRTNMTTFTCTENRTLNAVPVCQNIDECGNGTHGCISPATCHDTDGSYYCTCPSGYYIDTDRKTCLDVKECAVKNGYCDQMCTELPGSYVCTCPRDGYTLFTADGTANYTIPTSENGALNTDTFYLGHTCVRVSCPKPPEIANGTLLTNRQVNHYGDVIEYQCKLGYIPRRATLQCNKTGQWFPSPPTCQRATCSSDDRGTLINPASYTLGPYDYGNQLTLQCNVPGRGTFNKTRQCLYNRDSDNYSLYGNQYECGVIDCGSPKQVAGSNYVAPQSTTFGNSFVFVCGNLYTRQGNSSAGDFIVRCGNDSYWDFGSLQCVGTSCTDPGSPLGGRQVVTSYAQNSIVTFTCDRPGFSLSRSTGIECILSTTKTGLIWNDTIPHCVDTEKPIFSNCLNQKFIRKYQDVRAFLPTTLQVTDNGGGMKMQTISPQNANNTLYMTEQNLTVTYTAADFFDNIATCQLQYTLADETPPQITCIAKDVVTLYMPGDTYIYNVTAGYQIQATDNRDTNVTINIPDRILRGSSGNLNQVYTITGTAQDSAGNTDMCGYQVIVQAAFCSPLSLPTPVYGSKNCTDFGNRSYRCDLTCNPGYVFYDHQSSGTWSLTCTPSQAWPEVIPACIEDNMPPVLTCPSSYSVYLIDENSIINITPNETDFIFTDNSGQGSLTIPTSPFNITANNLRQTFRVSANAMDEKGNQVTCSYQILAQAATCSPLSLPTPLLGKKNCSATANGYACDLSCDAGYEFHERSELVVRSNCTTGNPWSIELPACASNVNKQSATYSQVFEYQYKNRDLFFTANLSCADVYRNGFDTKGLLQGTVLRLTSSCRNNYDDSLRISMPFDQVQLRINQGSSNGSIKFTVSVNFTIQIYSVFNVPSWALTGCKDYVENTMKSPNLLAISSFISNDTYCPSLDADFTTYNVTLHYSALLCLLGTVQSKIDPNNCLYCPEGYRSTGVRSCEKCGLGEYQDVINSTACKICPDFKTTSSMGTISSNQCYGECSVGLVSPSGFGPCNECPRNYYYVNRTHCEPCPSGYITYQSAALGPSYCISQNNLQLRCPMGTYQSNPGVCSLCPRGSYQNNEGSSSCIQCNSMFSTYAMGSTSSAACVAMCSGGFISDSGVPPCRQCPKNFYWTNSTYCSPCPNGGITLNTGAISSQLCLSQCSAGYFSYSGYGDSVTCRPCPLHHYQPSSGQISCIECANGQYTDGIGRTNITDCKDAFTNLCNVNTCRNGGNCTIRFHDYYCECTKGYYGRNCEVEVNNCLSQPCYNGGTCTSTPAGYSCTCPTGTNGSRCDTIENKCSQAIRCYNGGYCVNDFNEPRGYRCICPNGFGGANCSQQQSVCVNEPCQNGGQCFDVSGGLNLRRKCTCQPGYTGSNCETNINECDSNPCLFGATCTDLVNGYRCTCRSALYSGTNCETRRSPCQSVACGSGICVDDYLTDTYRCICSPGYYFGTTCDYKIYLGKIVSDISSLPTISSSNATSCRMTCDAQTTCQGFSLKDGICTQLFSMYTEGSLQTNSSYNTYLKSCFRPTDDYFSPWYDVDDPGADFSDMETLSVLKAVFGLNVCGGTDPVNAECRNKNNIEPYPGCSPSGAICMGNSTNPCADYEVRFQCAVYRVFSNNICYAKDYCEDGNPCMNGGACVSQTIGHHCNCPVGYTGLNCQTNINDCTSTSCLNGGVCIDGVNTFTCNCTSAYQGQNCQNIINYCSTSRCNSTNTRTCIAVENSYVCDCYPGYEGQFCEINIDECANQPCYHGGTCKDGINQYICDCTAGWTGVNCDQLRQPCNPQSCVGQATCSNIFNDFYCECPPSTYGKMCENTPNPCKDYNKCQNSATCNGQMGNMTCTCPNVGFMGDGCHVRTDLCGMTNYCQNGGTCYTSQTGYGCTCPKEYTGKNCETNIDDCASNPCPLNAACFDNVGQYYCRCPLGMAGESCSRTLDTNYDLYFYMPSKDGLATIPYPTPVGNTTGMAVSLWVRYAVPNDVGIFFVYWSGDTAKSAVPVFRLNDYGLVLLQENMTTNLSIPFKYNLKLNDGYWHNLVINYDSARREYSLIVDTIKHGAQVFEMQTPTLGSGTMWITLGCSGNLQTMNCYDKTGFRGHISQVNIYSRSLDFVNEIPQLINKPQIVFSPGLILQWNEYTLIQGVRQVIPSNVSLGSCQQPLSTSCIIRADREPPVIQNCPQDIIVYSNTRLKTVCWTEPTITGAKTTEISHRSGGTYTWGVYNVTYLAKDDNENAAICTFKIYVQALVGGLDNPDLGYQNCSTSGNFLACSIGCNSSLSIDRYAPKYFSKGPSGSFNVDDKLFMKPRYPSCGKKLSIAKVRISVKLVYKIVTSNCPGVKQALTDRLYSALSGAQGPNVFMNNTLCKQADCKDVNIVITCGSVSGRRKRQTTPTVVQLTFSESAPSTANGSLTVAEVLTNKIMSTMLFNFNDTIPDGSLDNNGFDISFVSICPQGQTEINGFCVLCGAGTYFTYYTAENISGYCENCPLGQYQNESGQSSCLPCSVPGSTTQTTGSTSAADCHASCSAGSYFDVSVNRCSPCQIGRYQNKTGQFYCEWCPVGYTTREINSTSLNQCFETCTSGQELNANGTCVPCEIGYYGNDTETSTCLQCQAGFITNSTGTISASNCNIVSCLAGSRRNVTSNTCIPCEKGTYQPDKWMTDCISCGPSDRWTTDNTGSANQNLCKYYCPSGYEVSAVTECRICSVGKYKDNSVNTFGVCIDCPAGYTSPTNGSTSIMNCTIHQCSAGSKNNANKTGCVKCPLGTYQPLIDQLDCLTCPANSSTRQDGNNNITACETYCSSGQEKVGDTCNQCPIGYYKDNNESLFGTCQRCPDGYVTPISNRTARALCTIRNCTAGTRRNANDTACEHCPLNTYQPDLYQTSCLNCSANTGTRQIRSTNVSQCETFCASGFEKTSTGCQPCPQGYYKDNSLGLFSVCTICPTDFITPGMNATSAAQCSIGNCTAGYYISPSNKSQCLPCAKGYYQPNKWNNSCIQCDTDKTTERNGSTTITNCILVCPPGKEDTGLGSCSFCKRGYYKTEYIAAKCTACPAKTTTVGEGANSSTFCSLPACEPGHYLDVARNICSLCDYDKYQDNFWQESCINCPTGYVTLNTGATKLSDCVVDCASGYEYVASSQNCRICPRGSYRNKTIRSQTSCSMCHPSQITSQNGATDVSQCNIANCTMPGQYRDPTSNTCKLCPIGTFVTEKWRDSCDQCISSYTTQYNGSTSSSDCKYDCPSGSSVDAANVCQQCPLGTYRTREATWTCQQCPNGTRTASVGSTSVNACNMSLCLAGQGYINQTCQLCPKGQYQPLAGQFNCTSCPTNRLFTLQTGATSITDCKSGCSVGQQFVLPSICQNCSRGTYQDQINEFTCKSCPPDRPYTAIEGAVNLNNCITSPMITNLTFTIRMTEMNFTDDLNNSSSVIYRTTRNKLVQTLDLLLGHFQGYSGARLLSFRRGSVKADVKVSVNQFGNISTIQAALKQSVSLGFIGLNGTTIAVDSIYFISYIREGYAILDGIYITNAGEIYNGSSVNITCTTTLVGNVSPSIVWKYNGNDINPVTGSRIRISTTLVDLETPQIINKTVTFDLIQSSDSGTYECVVLDGNSSPSVMNMTVFVLSQPEVFIQPVTQTVDVGSNVSITCQVVNNVSITQMVWYRNGTEINSTNQLSEENISFGNTTSILTYKNIQYTTKYECRGDNAAGQGNMRQAMIYVALSGPHHDETCTNETDERGIKWSRTLQGKYDNKPCPTGLSGEAVRYCSQGGVWRYPSYDNCINETLLALQILTDKIKNGLSPNTVQDSLVNLTHVTNPDNVELQKAEVQIVSTILDNVVQISNHTDNITNNEIENFLEIASNVIDVKNRPSWEALISKDQVGASIILRNVEKYSIIKAKSTTSPDEPVTRFTKKNLFVEIGYNLVGDIQFPNTTAYGSAFNNSSSSRFVLSQDALKNGNYTSYAGAYFNNVSGIVQKNLLHEGSIINTGDNLEINSAVLSLQLDPKPPSLSPPLILTFKHFSANYSNPKCSFWMFNENGHGNGSWSGEGCKLVSTSDDTTVCQCDHLTNFAILMSPGKTPTKDQVSLSIISIIGCAISIFCLSVTMVAHLIVWRYVKSARSHLLMNLCAALIISYIIFLAGIDRTENKNACTAVAALLHYFYLSVFFLMLAFGIEIAVSVIYVFVTSSRIRWLLPIAWILPAVIVAISLGVTRLEGYGNEKFCWLSIDDGLIWAFIGPAALVILLFWMHLIQRAELLHNIHKINCIIIIVVFHRMFSSSSMLTKSDKVKAKTAVRSLCVLLPITGITWVFGILSVNEDLVVFQYLFAIINSLQGLFIFLFNCVFNRHLKEAIKQMNASRKRSQVPVSTTLSNSSHSSGPKTRVTLDENQKNKASDLEASGTNSFLGSDRQMEKQIETYAKDDQLNTEYEESGIRIKDKRCGHNSSIQDVKISNILHDPKVRRERDHAQVATSSTTRANANTSADIDPGDPTNFRELERKKRSTATRARKAKDISRAKKHGKKNKRSLHYQYSAFDMVHMGPQFYHGSSQNIPGWILYNPYGSMYEYDAPWMYTMNPLQFHQPPR